MAETRNISSDDARRIAQHVEDLRPIFAWGAIGDFTRDVPMYEEDDELSEVYLGVQIMIDVIRSQLTELNKVNAELSEKILEDEQELLLRKEADEEKDRFISTLGHE